MPLEVVDHLLHIMPQPIIVDLPGQGCPPEVEVALLDIRCFTPELISQRAAFQHHPLDQGTIVSRVDLVLKDVLPDVLEYGVIMNTQSIHSGIDPWLYRNCVLWFVLVVDVVGLLQDLRLLHLFRLVATVQCVHSSILTRHCLSSLVSNRDDPLLLLACGVVEIINLILVQVLVILRHFRSRTWNQAH